MRNGIWLVCSYKYCEVYKKKVEVSEIYHIVPGNVKAVCVGMCTVCFSFMWGDIISEFQRQTLNIFMN